MLTSMHVLADVYKKQMSMSIKVEIYIHMVKD